MNMTDMVCQQNPQKESFTRKSAVLFNPSKVIHQLFAHTNVRKCGQSVRNNNVIATNIYENKGNRLRRQSQKVKFSIFYLIDQYRLNNQYESVKQSMHYSMDDDNRTIVDCRLRNQYDQLVSQLVMSDNSLNFHVVNVNDPDPHICQLLTCERNQYAQPTYRVMNMYNLVRVIVSQSIQLKTI